MTIPDVLDGAFAILKRRPRDVVLLAAAFVIPVQLIAAVLLRDVFEATGFAGTGFGDSSSVGVQDGGEVTGVGASVVAVLISTCSLALLTGALARLVADWYQGIATPAGRVLVLTLRRAPALLVGVVLVKILEILGLVGVGIGAYVAMALLHVVSAVIVAESVGPFRAVARSMKLTSRRFWRSMGLPALVGLIGMLLSLGFQIIPEVLVLLVDDRWNWLVRAASSTVSELVVAPFTAGVVVLYHLDLRIRTEGYDIQLALEQRAR